MSFLRNLKKKISSTNSNSSSSGSQGDSIEANNTENDGLGLKLLFEGNNPIVDIIAVHGLNGHREKTWTADNGKIWLKEFLPVDIPRVRIFTYGYNASTHGDPSIQCLHQHAEDFVDILALSLQDTPRRPIIFIAHSLGGILVKSALIHAESTKIGHLEYHKAIKLSTYGIVFMGTPHRGVSTTLGNMILTVASVVTNTNTNLVGSMERDGESLEVQLQSYRGINRDFDNVYCYETKPTPPSRKLVVPYDSAVVLGEPNASVIGIQADHVQMVKFRSNRTAEYERVSLHVKRMVAKATKKVEDNWAKWDQSKASEEEAGIQRQIERNSAPVAPVNPDRQIAQQHSSEVYAKLLSLEREGYPLWHPDLSGHLPQAYRDKGVEIGDIGYITKFGDFAFRFNIFLDSRHPINAERVPNSFTPWVKPQDTAYFANLWPERSVRMRGSVAQTKVQVQDANQPDDIEFILSAQECAILILPDGASRADLSDPEKEEIHQRLTEDTVLQWLEFTKVSTLLLVTGWVKSKTWAVAAVSNSSCSASLMFRTIKTGHHVTDSHRWINTGPGQCRLGPLMPSDEPNQCVFLRGFKLSSRKCLRKMGDGKAEVAITDIQSGEMMESLNGGGVTTSQNPQLLGGGASSASQQDQDIPTDPPAEAEVQPVESCTDEKNFFVPLMELTQSSHPLDIINEYLLRIFPDAQVAITHDDDWCVLIKETDDGYLGHHELLQRVHKKYQPVLQSGCARLVVREYLGPEAHSGVNVHCLEPSGDSANVGKAIPVLQNAVDVSPTPDGHANKPAVLNHLGNSFICDFKHSGDLVDIDKAITAYEQAVHFTPEDHPDKPGCLNNLGNSFLQRFECSGDLIDIDKAISAHEKAVHLTLEGHADNPDHLSNLGNSFLCRFEQSGDPIDIDKAISAHEQAVHLTPEGHAAKPTCLGNLSASFTCRFKHSGELIDIDKAISVYKQAVHLTPEGHAAKPIYLSHLGTSFTCRFKHSGELIDIDKAISAHEQAVHLTPEGHADKPAHLSNLGNSILQRFERFGDLNDIDNAISVHKQAVHLTPKGHAAMPTYLSYLGESFTCQFWQSGDPVHMSTAIKYFHYAATCSAGSPSKRFWAAVNWARLASTCQISSALHGYTVAFDLLPQVAWMGQTTLAQHSKLTSLGNIASEAAAIAISAQQYDTALEMLEQGRCVVWNQLLQLHTPIDTLHKVQPTLANDLLHLSKALEQASICGIDLHNVFTSLDLQSSTEEIAQGHRHLAEKWEMLIKRARDIPGFEDFLRPKKLAQLYRAADAGPVVVLNVHQHRCDALVLIAGLDGVMHIPLDHFSYKMGQELQYSLNQLLLASGIHVRGARPMQQAKTTIGADFPSILSALWFYIVKPVLDSLAITASGTVNPRIWWCTTGPLTFLPIHAAGIYNNISTRTNISDYVVSSYTPTLNALINAFKNHEAHHKFQGLLAVSQPNTPGQFPLPNTKMELVEIQKQAGKFSIDVLEGPAASVESVLKGMGTHSWVHLACHGKQDRVKPIKSAFCLQDGWLGLSRIITNSFPHADFALLSACQTATGDEQLSEEAVHLAAGMMLAGYCGVIATMWSIQDDDAPFIASHVYNQLFSDREPDSGKAAFALHHAVKCLREQVGDLAFLSWVPFIHVGA